MAATTLTSSSQPASQLNGCVGSPVDVDFSQVAELELGRSTFAVGESVRVTVDWPEFGSELTIASSVNVTCWTGDAWVAAWQTTIYGEDPRLSDPNQTQMTMHADARPLPVDVEIRIPMQAEPGMYRAWLPGFCPSCERSDGFNIVVDFEVVDLTR